ncbi:MAG: fibronectin type III domain-containing protein [Desulfobacca sp.]|uniref:fibronectin type III domain-containing protein n=1 Tax=Desulfobacca sp. TaxID=2067990 RepID=UPI004049B603
MPPDSLVPGEVRNFSVRQDGSALRLTWLLPRINIDNQPLTDIQGFRILRQQASLAATGGCPLDLQPLAVIDLSFPQMGEVSGEVVSYRDENVEPGWRYFYQVVGFARGGQAGVPSAILSHAWDTLPQAPAALQAQAGDRQVQLVWPPVRRLADGRPFPGQPLYTIYRQTPEGGWLPVHQTPLTDTTFLDIGVENDVSYRYLVRALRKIGPDVLESLDSPQQTAKPVDLTPPAPVVNLVAVPTDQGIELRWEPGREPDLAGYLVWRRSLAEPQFQQVTPQLVAKPYFVDTAASKGVTYFYTVIAVDNSRQANRSLPSEIVSASR